MERKCFIRHKHGDEDNDFFMVLGQMKNLDSLTDFELDDLKKQSVSFQDSVRGYLEKHDIDVPIDPEQVFLAQYEDETLSLNSTRVYSIENRGIDETFIQNLYD